MRQIYPAGTREPEIGAAGPAADPAGAAPEALARLYAYPRTGPGARRAWVRANMVASADGAATLAGVSGGLSGSADRDVFAVLRSLADVILVGAGTARAERYATVAPDEIWQQLRADRPPTPPVAVVTRMLDLDLEGPLLTAAPGHARTIVLTTEAASARLRAKAGRTAEVIVTGRDQVTPAAIIGALAERGHRHILAEGGPALLDQIVTAGLLDELCLTVSPVLAGSQGGRITAALPAGAGTARPAGQQPTRLRLAHVLEESGYLLCRYLRETG